MAFHSFAFLLGFLPLTLLGFFLAKRMSGSLAVVFLAVASVVFFALGEWNALPVLFVSLAWNYGWGFVLDLGAGGDSPRKAKLFLAIGIGGNILLLAFFKYAAAIGDWIPGDALSASVASLALPLAISFYTFTQISYLIEVANGTVTQPNFLRYAAFVLFFPKLVAGPIARASAVLPQLSAVNLRLSALGNVQQALSFLIIGLFKKIIIADQLVRVVSPVFSAALQSSPTFYRAWFGAVAYGLQLYFDFSGYSDMAIGVALLFGVALPINFDSPYTAVNISEFWRKWHITLSSFFRDYVYIPLGGNRKGYLRKLLNAFIVMVLCGIWHGYGLTFAIWGALHGLGLCIHTLWMSVKKKWGGAGEGSFIGRLCGRALTFVTITVLWVFFRAENLPSAMRLLSAMFSLPARLPFTREFLPAASVLIVPLVIVWFFPTTQQWLRYSGDPVSKALPATATAADPQVSVSPPPTVPSRFRVFSRGLVLGCLAVAAVAYLSQSTAFLYGNF